jgi:glutamyl-tRNA reductase
MNLLLFGVTHQTASLEDREALAFSPEEIVALLAQLHRCGNLREVALLATCNRTEFYMVAVDADGAEQHLRDAVRRVRGRDLLGPGPHRKLLTGANVARHLFRVACGLESMVLGDVQILGQVKDAFGLARDAGTTGPWLDRLFETALHAGKRSRAETAIGAGTVSMASAAVELALQLSGLEDRQVVVIGAGDTSRLAAEHAASHGARVTIVNRTRERADALAAAIDGTAADLDRLPEVLATADVVFSATRSPHAVVTAGMLRDATARRPGHRLLVVDLAVPRDVEPAAAEIPGVELRAIDGIRSVVDQHLAGRLAHVPAVEAIADDEAVRYAQWMRSLGAKSTMLALRDHFERIRSEEMDRQLTHATREERELAEKLTRALINRLLHVPTLRLKDADPSSDDGQLRLQAAQELFALGGAVEDRRRRAHA